MERDPIVAIDDRRRDDALDRFWDGLVQGAEPEPDGLALETAEIVRRLHALGDEPDQSGARARVWDNLSTHPIVKGSTMQTVSGLARPSPLAYPPPRSRHHPATLPTGLRALTYV